MLQFTFTKIGLVVVVILASIFFAAPNLIPSSMVAQLPSWWRPVQLALDLRGGSYLLLEVDTATVLKDQLIDEEESARAALRDAKLRYRSIRSVDDGVIVQVVDPADQAAARQAIAKGAQGTEIDVQ